MSYLHSHLIIQLPCRVYRLGWLIKLSPWQTTTRNAAFWGIGDLRHPALLGRAPAGPVGFGVGNCEHCLTYSPVLNLVLYYVLSLLPDLATPLNPNTLLIYTFAKPPSAAAVLSRAMARDLRHLLRILDQAAGPDPKGPPKLAR